MIDLYSEKDWWYIYSGNVWSYNVVCDDIRENNYIELYGI